MRWWADSTGVGEHLGRLRDRLDERVELTTRIWIPPYPNPEPGGDPIVDGHWRDITSYDDLDASEEGAIRRSGGPKTIGGYPPSPGALERLMPRPEAPVDAPGPGRFVFPSGAVGRVRVSSQAPYVLLGENTQDGTVAVLKRDADEARITRAARQRARRGYQMPHVRWYTGDTRTGELSPVDETPSGHLEALERKTIPFHSTRPVPFKMYAKGSVATDAEGHDVVLRDDGTWAHVDPEIDRMTGAPPVRVDVVGEAPEPAPPVQVHAGLPSAESPPGQLQFPEPPKPRVRRPKAEPAIIAGPNPAEMREAIAVGNERFLRHNHAIGGRMRAPGPVPTDKLMAIEADEVTGAQRAEATKLIDKFMGNPSMQPYFERFGRPTFLVAARTYDGADPRTGGAIEGEVGRSRKGSVLAAWRAGVVTVYAPTAADPVWLKQRKIPIRGTKVPKVSGGPGNYYVPEITSVMDWSGRDAVLRHEYGHQVIFHAFDTKRPDGASDAFGGRGGQTVVDGFFRAMFDGKSYDEVMAEIGSRGEEAAIPPDLNRALNRSLIPISTYATLGGVHEAAAEAFAVVTDPRYDRETSPYPPEAQRVLDFVEDLVK
jgi:hypothetical protein